MGRCLSEVFARVLVNFFEEKWPAAAQTAALGSYLNSHKATKAETYWWEVYTQEFIFI